MFIILLIILTIFSNDIQDVKKATLQIEDQIQMELNKIETNKWSYKINAHGKKKDGIVKINNDKLTIYTSEENVIGEYPIDTLKFIKDEDGDNLIKIDEKIFAVYKIFDNKVKLFISADSDEIKIVNINYE